MGIGEDGPTLSDVERLAKTAATLLRVAGHEVQLTKALGGLMGRDPHLARVMLTALLSRSGVERLAIPGLISLEGETETERKRRLRAREPGRIDWRFYNREARFQVLVEVKVNTTFAHTQLQRYLDDPDLKQAESGGLIALTRDAVVLSHGVTDHPRWIGLVRWRDLLQDLRLSSDDQAQDVNRLLWNALIDVIESSEDLGYNYPTWVDLLSASHPADDATLGKIARAAIDKEIIAMVTSRVTALDLTSSRRGPRARIAIFGAPDWILRVEVHRGQAPSVSAAARIPVSPVRRRRDWEAAVQRCQAAHWVVERNRLTLRPLTLDQQLPPHLAVARALAGPVEALVDPMLWPRFAGLLGGSNFARSSDLAEFST
jgi:hypothetical protein